MLEENLFGNALKSLRVRRGKLWTQGRTAELLGISLRTYAKWEDEDEGNIPSSEYLKKIAALFELSQEESDTLYRAAAQTPPQIHNLPFPRNPFFTGRTTYLEQLGQFLQENDSVAITQPVSVSGLGGMGKTQLALEYAHRCFPQVYRAVFWVNAADRASLETSYDTLAQLLELPAQNEQVLDRRIQAVKKYLEDHTSWLLVMDNADDLPLARTFFPRVHRGRILLTTRSQLVGNIVARQIEIDKMMPDEGVLFLLRRSRMLQAAATFQAVAPDIREAAFQLVELLGGHPLALDQAGAYIEGGVSFTDYIDRYRVERQRLLDERGSLEGEYNDHPESVVVTFELCFNQARERHPVAIDILCFCAFLHPDDIPYELFQYDDRFSLDALAFNAGIASLLRYSLIKRNAQERFVSVHRLVQAVLVDAMSPDLQKQWRERVVRALDDAFPEVESMDWKTRERLLSHALVCATWKDDELPPIGRVGELLHRVARYLYAQGQHDEAQILLGIVIMNYNQHSGVEQHRTKSRQWHNLPYSSSTQGNIEEFELWYRRALKVVVTQLAADYPRIAFVLHNPLFSNSEQGNDEVATIELHILKEHASSLIHDQLHAERSPSSALLSSKALLDCEPALMLHRKGEHVQAEKNFKKAFRALEQQLGSAHPLIQDGRKVYAELIDSIERTTHTAALEVDDEQSE